jgi:hypothetical protein
MHASITRCTHFVQAALAFSALGLFPPSHAPRPLQVAAGRMLGPDQPVILHLLDIEPAKQALEGVKMELLDAAYPLLQGESPSSHLLFPWLRTQQTVSSSLQAWSPRLTPPWPARALTLP